MKRQAVVLISLVGLGIVLRVVLQALGAHVFLGPANPDAPARMWPFLLAAPWSALVDVAPPFFVGWLARNRGGILGASVGALSSLAANLAFHPELISISLLADVLAGLIMGAAAGLGGQHARSPSNKSFKPNPLRGSA